MSRDLYTGKENCSGCEACANVCPVSIIAMRPDPEGFYYPVITDEDKCIHCKRCEAVCPEKHISAIAGFKESAFAGYSKSEDELKSSASGGLATAMSKKFINDGGIVYGVSYGTGCNEILYQRAAEIEGLDGFKTSKYAQSRKYDVYRKVLSDLKADRKVLFIGLPCECNALHLFLGKEYRNLFVCSLICHGPTSPKVHTEYCQSLQEEHTGSISEFSVRYKKEGWKPYYIRAKYEDRYEHLEKFAESTYGIAFLYMKRPSCNVCKIKREKVYSDISIGDYHLAFGGTVKPYNPNGVSSCIVHTDKGMDLINGLEDFLIEPVTVKSVLYSEAYYKAIPQRKNRAEFGRVFSESGLEAACGLKSIDRIEKELALKKSLKHKAAVAKKAAFSILKKNKG